MFDQDLCKFHRGGEGAQIFFINRYKDSERAVESRKTRPNWPIKVQRNQKRTEKRDSQSPAGSRFINPGISGMGFCKIQGSRDFSGRD